MTALPPYQLRQQCRSGAFSGNTSGLAPGFVQANMAIIPAAYAADFLQFCHFNPKPCPLLGMAATPGAIDMPTLAKELDIRSLNAELSQIQPSPEPLRPQKPARSIDLHIEQLHDKPDSLSNSEKMRIQLEVFEKNLNVLSLKSDENSLEDVFRSLTS